MKKLPPSQPKAVTVIYPLKECPFRIAIAVELENGYELKDMTLEHVKEFHRFVQSTVFKIKSIGKEEDVISYVHAI